MEYFTSYFNALRAANLAEMTEHSLRPELKSLLSAIANDVDRKITILHEGKREGKFGAPDFKVSRLGNIIGYVENKKIGEPLEKIVKSDQIKKYQQLSDNILLTNYLEWMWLNQGQTQRATLCALADIEQKNAKLDPNNATSVEALIQGFFSFAPEGIGKPKALAEALAIRGKALKEFLAEELHRQEGEETKGKLFGLYDTFQKYVFNELTLADFADTFSQNLIYGLFLAKLNAGATAITLHNAELFIAANFELIRELVEFLNVLQRKEYADIRWVVEEILTILNTMNLRDIAIALSFTRPDADNDDPYAAKDPYVYFYEDFLAAYDKNLRKSKGVYYTPPQVVNFIVRAVDDTLRDTFGLPDGLADHERVTVLDFATGTGTFLLEVIRQIFQKVPSASERNLLIRDHILKNLYGFEYLIAPYTIAHLKLSQFLKDTGYALGDEERLQIFLTNTLEPTDRQINIPMLPALTEETKRAQHVKDKPILVIIGNPPYSGHSKNNSAWIQEKLRAYYQVDGKKLEEKNPKWLQDDYVKFIRFAQDKMDQVEEGVVAIITNHSFLDNPTFRGMRQSLMKTFHQMYFIDLHGNAKKREQSPKGEKDENVFDIEQGVAISLLIKKNGIEKGIYHADFWGNRNNKYLLCLHHTLQSLDKKMLKPASPFYFFQYEQQDFKQEYEQGMSLQRIFQIGGMGITTAHDGFVVDFDRDSLLKRFIDFKNSEKNAEKLHKQFKVKRKEGWDILQGWQNLQNCPDITTYIQSIAYRPFDPRFIFYEDKLVWRTVKNIMSHMMNKNYALCLIRRNRDRASTYFVTNAITDKSIVSSLDNAAIFPLYLYEKQEGLFTESSEPIKTENLTKEFRQLLEKNYHTHYTPEQVFGAIYALLYSPSYRKKYAEFLKIDFPRFIFPETQAQFEHLAALGWQLIQVHLLKTIPAYPFGEYQGKGKHNVVAPDYRKNAEYERLYINPTQYFDHIPENVYQFQIGGYQVLEKYLKDRKERILTLTEVKTVRNTVKALAFTIEQMQTIDDATKDWI